VIVSGIIALECYNLDTRRVFKIHDFVPLFLYIQAVN